MSKGKIMKANVGGIDRILRIVVGIVLIAIALFLDASWAKWCWVGVVPLLGGLIGYCPLYSILKINTCKK